MRTKSKAAAGRYRVGANLYKQIAASGAGSWVLRYELRGRKRWMGLGPIAVFSQKEAMARARAAQQLIYAGTDPIDTRRQERAEEARKAILSVTLEAAAQSFYDGHEAKWKSALVLLIVSMVIGSLFGYASNQLAKVLATKQPTMAVHA
jgi:hypothetical protein